MKTLLIVLALAGLVVPRAVNVDSVSVAPLVVTSGIDRAGVPQLVDRVHNSTTPFEAAVNGTVLVNIKDDDPSWDKLYLKGLGLNCLLKFNGNPTPNPWNDYNTIGRYGWQTTPSDPGAAMHDYQDAFEDLLGGADLSGRDFPVHLWEHTGSFTNTNGQQGDRLKAHYKNRYSVRYGVIINVDRKSPRHMLKIMQENGLTNQVVTPDYERYSDIAWLEWANRCHSAGVNPNTLRFIFSHDVVTLVTKEILRVAVQRLGKQLDDWPGVEIAAGSHEGNAIMGTPHGSECALSSSSCPMLSLEAIVGVARILLDHRNEIRKKVGSWVVWLSDFDPDVGPGQEAGLMQLLAKLVDL